MKHSRSLLAQRSYEFPGMQVKTAHRNMRLSGRDCEMRRQHDVLLVLQHRVGEALSRTADDLVVKQTNKKRFPNVL